MLDINNKIADEEARITNKYRTHPKKLTEEELERMKSTIEVKQDDFSGRIGSLVIKYIFILVVTLIFTFVFGQKSRHYPRLYWYERFKLKEYLLMCLFVAVLITAFAIVKDIINYYKRRK